MPIMNYLARHRRRSVIKPALVFFGTLLLIVLSGCTTPPDHDFSALQAEDAANPSRHLTLLKQQGETLTGMPFVAGNAAELLRDGNSTFPAMLAAIHRAHHYIYLESFTFDAKAGKEFAEALVARRRSGVKVDLIYDAFGSSDTPPGIFDYLRKNGVNLVEFNPITVGTVLDGDADNRDHRKLLVVDGETAFVGGVNISAVYLHKQSAKPFFGDTDASAYKHIPWRDTHVKISGPVVGEFERVYKHTWLDQNGDPDAFSVWKPDLKPRGDTSIEAVYGAPINGRFNIYESLLMAISLAHKTVHLTSGYFAPTPELRNALKDAVGRGVDVVLLLPSVSDSDTALDAGRAQYADLLDAGIKIFEFQDEVLHAKSAVIDDVWSTVGSSNLDWRSAAINNECNAIILANDFGADLEATFQDDIKHSKKITADDWVNRSFGEKFDEF